MQTLAFVDLETTGASVTKDRITEIGIVLVDQGGIREWSHLVQPPIPIPVFIERMTGISNAMVMDAPTFADIAQDVAALLQDCLFIAHNANFDYGFLKNEFGRAGIAFRPAVLCTVKLSRMLYPQYRHHNLDSLMERHGLTTKERHRALADARLIYQFWKQANKEFSVQRMDAIVQRLIKPSRLS